MTAGVVGSVLWVVGILMAVACGTAMVFGWTAAGAATGVVMVVLGLVIDLGSGEELS